MDAPFVYVEEVRKSFQKGGSVLPVLDTISLSAEPGTIISILGKSGCGKSTFLNILASLEKPDSGKVSVKGKISYVPQHDSLLPWRTVTENILLPIEISGGSIKEAASNAQLLLKHSDLHQFAHAYPGSMSGGMKQRISFIRALVQDCDVILFDEPFSAIDFDMRLRLGKQVREHIISKKKIGIFVTHNIEEAISLGDQLIIFGQIPASIVFKDDILLSEKNRDPVEIRKTKDFQHLFAIAWATMSKKYEE